VVAILPEFFRDHRRTVAGDEFHAFDIYFMQVLCDEFVTAFNEVFSSATGRRLDPAAIGEVTDETESTRVAVVGLFVYLLDVT
jgi:hypothetical protein